MLAVLQGDLQTHGRVVNAEGAECPGRPLQRMREPAGIFGHGGEGPDQADRLGRKHRQHLALKAVIAQRHAPEMFDINRTVIGSEWWRWHPFYPFRMKRHGNNPDLSAPPDSHSEVWSANHGIG